ncbi:hypothetical protein FSP39_009388 [Pinctada imbricata]|uniref:Uncharacterized protein n=1 Tax=Pinctada imbricata TaxID=66713 RepID=A0AA88YCJ6_PINIB|nr:hypothetical protein FSP39_009388 [Pinctada imbricata]
MSADMDHKKIPRLEFGDGKHLSHAEASQSARQIRFSLDMVEAALAHIEFLTDVDKHPCLYHGQYVQNAISRYENLWLPLAAKHLDERLTAPLDIEWIWHCHLLAPVLYEKDCIKFFQNTVNHKLYRRFDRAQALKRSKSLWEEAYPNEPFEIDLPVGPIKSENVENYDSKIAYDLTAATSRQCAFFYNVSLPHYLDRKFLSLSELRYKMFLFLRKYARDAYLVPCFDNDLMWHTHQLHPLIYKVDSLKILGRFFNHDDTTNDRSEGTILSNGTNDTIKLWRQMFGCEYSMAGAMFRGKVSRGLYHNLQNCDFGITNNNSEKSQVILSLENVALEWPPDGEYGFDFIIEMKYLDNSGSERQFRLEGPNLVWTRGELSDFVLKSTNEMIKIQLLVKNGKIFHKYDNCEKFLDVSGFVSAKSTIHPFYSCLSLKGKSADNNLHISGIVREIYPETTVKLTVGDYKVCVQPGDLDTSFPVEPLDGDPCTQCGACYLAQHRLLSATEQTVLNCKVFHNPHRIMSGFHIYQGMDPGNLVCCGHLIDSSHLPLPSLVMDPDRNVTLDPGLSERAVLIKDNDGDWAILTAHWSINPETNKGALCLKFFHCVSGLMSWHWLTGSEGAQPVILYIGNCLINISDASLQYTCNTSEVPQYTALSLAVGLLLVLCLPRPRDWIPGNSAMTNESLALSPDSLRLAVACGLTVHTPSNHYRSEQKRLRNQRTEK